ncbi:MAG TPA: hypothetical protein VHB20_11760 [Verrucomicrobiae bacterium]|jgi:hypothetical protein|nr:hypothetical protein [Verrucomicrobiae bacterium]
MELKLLCGCGQKYKFDVEPAGGQMPFAVNCPVCGVDGTPLANAQLAQVAPPLAPPPPITARVVAARPAYKAAGQFNLGMGVAGAFLGAAVAAGLMYGFFAMAGFRFPLLGVGVGAATGYLAQLLGKGRDSTLGAIAAAIALTATGGTLWMMYGEVPMISIISIVVSASVAYRTAA